MSNNRPQEKKRKKTHHLSPDLILYHFDCFHFYYGMQFNVALSHGHGAVRQRTLDAGYF